LGGSIITTIQHTYAHITQNNTTKNKHTNKTKKTQISSQSYTDSEKHIAAKEYSLEKETK
jgi:hypothetical protein